jgi:hypothetical protein
MGGGLAAVPEHIPQGTYLGEFGHGDHPDAEGWFGWFDTQVRLHPALSVIDLADFLELLDAAGTSPALQASAIKECLRGCVHPDDFPGFWAAAKAHRQTQDDLMEVVHAAVELATARPTVPPSDSSAGPGSTPESSTGGSLSRVLDRLSTRGDLQLVVWTAAKAKQDAAAAG